MKAFFYSRQLREKLLLTGFLLLVAAVWLTNIGGRCGGSWREWRTTSAVLANQQRWIDRRAAAGEALTRAVAHLDPARTFNSGALLSELSRITDKLDISSTTSSEITGTVRSSQLAVHTVNCRVGNISQPAILGLVDELNQRSPYISIEEFVLSVAPNYAININLRLSSVEVLR